MKWRHHASVLSTLSPVLACSRPQLVKASKKWKVSVVFSQVLARLFFHSLFFLPVTTNWEPETSSYRRHVSQFLSTYNAHVQCTVGNSAWSCLLWMTATVFSSRDNRNHVPFICSLHWRECLVQLWNFFLDGELYTLPQKFYIVLWKARSPRFKWFVLTVF